MSEPLPDPFSPDPPAPKIDYSRRYTVEEYFEIELRTGFRHEYYNGEIFPLDGPDVPPEMMAGATRRHNDLVYNCRRALTERLRNSGCRVYAENVRTRMARGKEYAFPDIVVTCDPNDRDERLVTSPNVIMEVLSDSTEARDRGWKMEQYFRISSLMQYVLISQGRVLIESYTRGEGETWIRAAFDDRGAFVPFPVLGLEVSVSELYEFVQVPEFRLWRNPEPPAE